MCNPPGYPSPLRVSGPSHQRPTVETVLLSVVPDGTIQSVTQPGKPALTGVRRHAKRVRMEERVGEKRDVGCPSPRSSPPSCVAERGRKNVLQEACAFVPFCGH